MGSQGTTSAPSPTATGSAGWLGLFKADFLASVVVFLVALPLCMGIANACGLPPALGLITGIIGGVIVGSLAGCPLQVSGPAAGLVVVVTGIVNNERFGDTQNERIAMMGVILLGAGLMQIVAGLLRLGQWFRAVSPAVIEGMLAGIGVLIFASQFHVMVDDEPHKGEHAGIHNLISIPEAVYKGLVPPPAEHSTNEPENQAEEVEEKRANHQHAAQIGFLTILVLLFWKTCMPKRLQLIPAPLVGIVVATLVCLVMGYVVKRVPMPQGDYSLSLSATFPWVSFQGGLFEEIRFPTWPVLSRIFDKQVWLMMATVAFVASAETLLCATAVDQLQQGPRTRYDKELWAQGIGNVLCGLLGALPMTGVIVRSAANVEAGAKSRASAILHGVWLLLMVILGTALLRQMPTSALAAVLVYTGYRLVKLEVVKELWHWGWSEVAIFFCTMIGVVALGLLEGVLIGVVLAVIKLLYRFSHLSIRLETDHQLDRTVLYLEGAATFLRLPQLAATLEKVPPATELHVHFENLTYIDHACLELLMTWEKQHEAVGGSLIIDWDNLHGRFHQGPNGKPRESGSGLGLTNGHAVPDNGKRADNLRTS